MKKNEPNRQPLTAAIINLGCKVNKYEADAMKDKLINAGMLMVEPEDVADIYIVNTCSVTNMAQRKSRQMLRRAKKRNPEAVVIAAGCYVNAEHDVLKGEDFVDVVVGNNCKKDIVEVIREYMDGRVDEDCYVEIGKTGEYEEMGSLSAAHLDHQRAYIKIQDGCNQFCSYCIIPYTRGRVRSRRPEHIIEEIRGLAKTGVKEFVLTGIHISSYGIDFKGKDVQYDSVMDKHKEDDESDHMQSGDFGDQGLGDLEQMELGRLIGKIAEIPEVRRIRLGSLEPRIITEEFLERITASGKVCPHFHLSLQSGCDATLKRMNRKYDTARYMESCDLLRQYFDDPAITTDLITGFPEETEEEFAQTLDFIARVGFADMHVFPYSIRPGTKAAEMRQIDMPVREERAARASAVAKTMHEAYLACCVGKIFPVLFERDRKGGSAGHAPNYMEVSVAQEGLHNQVKNVKITAVDGGSLRGELEE